MTFRTFRCSALLPAAISCLLAVLSLTAAHAQSSDSKQARNQSSSSQPVQQEKAPSLIDPAGPTISLVSSEPVFLMAAALNACGYAEGLDDSAPVRKHVRDEVSQALKSLSHPVRLKVLCQIMSEPRSVGELTEFCRISQSAMSQFLDRMRSEGIVSSKREGTRIFYQIADPRLVHLLHAIKDIYC